MSYAKYSILIVLQLQLLCSCLPIKKGPGPQAAETESSEHFLAKFYAKKQCNTDATAELSVNRMRELVIMHEESGIFTVKHRLDFDLYMTKNNEATLEYQYMVSYEKDGYNYEPSYARSRTFRKKLNWRYDETTLSFFDEVNDTRFDIIRAPGGDSRDGPVVNPVKMFDELPSDLVAKIFSNSSSYELGWGGGSLRLDDESIPFVDECDESYVYRHDNQESYRQELVYQLDCSKPENAKYIELNFFSDDGHDTSDMALGAINADSMKVDVFLMDDGRARLNYVYKRYGFDRRQEQEGSISDATWSYENYQLVINRDNGTDAKLVVNTENQNIIKVIDGENFFSDINFGEKVLTDNPLFSSKFDVNSVDIEDLQVSGVANFCQ